MLATKSVLPKILDNDICYALIRKQALFSHDDIPSSVTPVVTNFLQKYEDVFTDEIPP
jgi:hypothetical protein